jgi:outer membrane protein OmpA-like peptidoglycan-associated protein
MLKLKVACSVLAVLGLLAGPAAAAEKPSQDQIIKALTPKKPLTRSLSVSAPADNPQASADRQFINSLRNRPTRSLSSDEREKIVAIAKDQPSIDLEINFNFNSATVAPAAMADVEKLGKALSDPALKGGTFVLSGHTDAIGSDASNLDLSNRRADAVKRILVEKYGVPAENLVTAGYGESKLKNAENPKAAENRRVQIVNMAEKVAER